jgi:citrate lyase subunit gamma (acyl carrier protein)
MEINKTAIAGTLESSDVQIMISKGTSGIQFEVESDVEKQFGDQIRQTVTDVLRQYDV